MDAVNPALCDQNLLFKRENIRGDARKFNLWVSILSSHFFSSCVLLPFLWNLFFLDFFFDFFLPLISFEVGMQILSGSCFQMKTFNFFVMF